MAVVLLRGGVVRVVESESAVAEEEAAARPCCWWPSWPGRAGGRALLPLHLPPQHPDPTVTLAAPAAAAQPASNAGRAVPCTGGDVRWQAKITTLHVTLACTWRDVTSKTQILTVLPHHECQG